MIENAIGIEVRSETESESDHANPLGIITPNLPAIHLRGATKKLEKLQRRPSDEGPTKYGIRGECTRHPNIRWNMLELLRGNKKLTLLLRLLGGRARPPIRLQTLTRMEFRPSFLSFLPRSPPLLTRIQFTQGRVNHRRLHLHQCRFHNSIQISQLLPPPALR